MAVESATEMAVNLLDPSVKKDTAQVVVVAADLDKDVEKDNATGSEKLAQLFSRIQELEKSIEELKQKKDAAGAMEKEAEEEAEEDAKSKPSFGSLPKVGLVRYEAMQLSYNVVNRSEKLSSCAIVAFYDVPVSVVDNLDAWEAGSQTPGYLPSRVSINSNKILELLKTITDTNMTKAPSVMMPPFKVFATYWTEIEAKLKELQDDFVKRHKHKWDAKPDDDSPVPRPLKEADAKEEVDKEGATQNIQHLQCLVDFMAKHLHEIPALREQIKSKQIDSISFDDLWHLFNPGDIILNRASSGKSEQLAYQVFTVTKGRRNMKEVHINIKKVQSERPKSTGRRDRNDLQLQCFSLDYDGAKMDTREEMLYIKPFEGKKRIADLDYYPMAFAADKDVVENHLLERARRFIDGRYGHGRCDGITARFEMEHVDGEDVFVDFKSGYEELPAEWKEEACRFGVVSPPDCQSDETYEPSCGELGCTSCTSSVYFDEQVDIKRAQAARDKLPKSVPENKIETLKSTPERLLLLPRHLLVYTLRTKKWRGFSNCLAPCFSFMHLHLHFNPSLLCGFAVPGFVDVQDFEKIEVNADTMREGWKNLVIDPKTKRLLKAMVSDHAKTMNMDKASLPRSGTSIDIVRGKGRGRIVFLYGPPGTSTAETIAAFTDPPRPLYPITCGDLGSDPKMIQEALEGHFKRAHRWNCVLLLDEADVYLAERHRNDLDRNGIVSVFLRTLEYYSGILFLTSNRVGSIDLAFKSRIHMALGYKRIDLKGTLKIWGNILDGIEKENADPLVKVKIDFDREDLLAWAEEHFTETEENGLSTWNGRQIRNAFQTAIALASHDRLENIRKLKIDKVKLPKERAKKLKKHGLNKISLQEEHFQDVSKIVHEFNDYLTECGNDEDKAVREGMTAPEVRAVQTQAYGRIAYGTPRAKEQRTRVQAKARAKPASTSRNLTRHHVINSRSAATTVNEPDQEDEDDSHGVDVVDVDDMDMGEIEHGRDAGSDDDDGDDDDDDDEGDDDDVDEDGE
ncbi:hypothetical protein EDB81DRAFT_954032 [Dactylonectria macrodidyma]|uniref:AAA+ ATPase domain-containing protein n=1 Tax=Dactylonectria macrodidyma TaxID=307937 RepID=A0A9P9D1H5_9HYPO|nr:hypothetical protein EDB81DRAFT_954032 [Dactylonectria macrodidyma]